MPSAVGFATRYQHLLNTLYENKSLPRAYLVYHKYNYKKVKKYYFEHIPSLLVASIAYWILRKGRTGKLIGNGTQAHSHAAYFHPTAEGTTPLTTATRAELE